MKVWLTILALGAGTYALRAAFIVSVGSRRLPEPLEVGLKNVGPAVLAALVTSLLTFGDEAVVGIAEVAGIGATILVAWRTRQFLWAFGAGMAAWAALGLWF